MKILLFLCLAVCLTISSCTFQNPVVTAENENLPTFDDKNKKPDQKSPVLVELFTSQGCSSCPPADRALAFLQKEQPYMQAELITLAFHVDYWNRLGWEDEFSSPLFSQRQEIYASKFKLSSVYTPQMVVDGEAQFTGSDLGKASKEIIEAAKIKKAKIEMSLNAEQKLTVKISDYDSSEPATIFLAIAENGLVTKVKSGENAGQTLEHSAVVRELKTLGTLDLQKDLTEIETVLNLQPNLKKENLKAVVFVQNNKNRKLTGVRQIGF